MADLSRVVVDFTWSPQDAPNLGQWTVNGNTYPPTRQIDNIDRSAQVGSLDSRYVANTTTNNSNLTFTATAVLPAGVTIVEYRWDFGDGTIGYGPTIIHNYLAAVPQTQVNLTATDSNRQVWTRSKTLRLRFANKVMVKGFEVKNA